MTQPPTGERTPSSIAPRWARALLTRVAAPERVDEVIGDLEEVHWDRLGRHGRTMAMILTALEVLDMAAALLRERRDLRWRHSMAGKRRLVMASSLDFKLGLRMLARYPSLTAVAVLAMAFGIATGAGGFQLMKELIVLPLPWSDEDRIVRLENVSTATTFPEPRTLHDFFMWRDQLRSVEHLSALHLRERNLSMEGSAAIPVSEAAVSATAFNLVRVRPLLGRPLVPADEAPGAAAVAVIGHQLWQERFGGDRNVVGRIVRLGGEQTTVIGVMPKSFAFFAPREGFTMPPRQHVWTPFRLRATGVEPGGGPPIIVFGRMAPRATAGQVQAELATLAARMMDGSGNVGGLRPQVRTFDGTVGSHDSLIPAGVLTLSGLFLMVLMVVVCGNVALLLFARAATRQGEIAIRTALGASRARIVTQLFAEALVIAALAIVVGLAGAAVLVRWTIRVLGRASETQGLSMPPWISDTLSPTTIIYAVLLAGVGAVVAGVLPGLKVTGVQAQASLQRLAGRGSGVRLGGVWTAIIITQVTLTVMLVPIAVRLGLQTWEMRTVDQSLPAPEYLSVGLEMDALAGGSAPTPGAGVKMDDDFAARFEQGYRALERRLIAEAGVLGVTVATLLPGGWHPRPLIALESAPLDSARSTWEPRAQIASVDPDFFDVMHVPVISGRAFGAADIGTDQRVVIVNESFVRELLGGRNAIGERLRYRDPGAPDGWGPWYSIVGVTQDLAMTVTAELPNNAGIYHPLRPGAAYPLRMAVRVAGEPGAFTGRLHEIAADAAPGLRLQRPLRIDQAARGNLIAYDAWFRVIVVAAMMALLLTNAGIYSVIAFTVARRTREIGVRVALGADRRQVISAILARTARHVTVGVGLGATLGFLGSFAMAEGGWEPSPLQSGGLLVAYMVVMTSICLLACVVPTRRALRIQPTEALAADG